MRQKYNTDLLILKIKILLNEARREGVRRNGIKIIFIITRRNQKTLLGIPDIQRCYRNREYKTQAPHFVASMPKIALGSVKKF